MTHSRKDSKLNLYVRLRGKIGSQISLAEPNVSNLGAREALPD